ncbi:hypothetical protein PENSUB_6040 [Penicillium subrubescens]|uniref:RING-type domain-containing protein n=1 Tax=Penicillium subrubescens TaxID=1316194 RepID=A0A1Q5U4Q6_9EURO|nr:hypothetical protein PENSUB_6040 [Penicillium subrubescens]
MNPEISFGDSNSGLQIGINNGPLNTQQLHLTGDINIPHSVYKSLFNAPDLFTQVRDELGLLVSVLIATEEHAPKFRPDDPQLSELEDVLSGCYSVLQDLVRLKEHFDNVGAQTQVTWERMGWGGEELAEIRGKFSLHIQVLNFLNTRMLRSSHENVERMLEAFIGEIRSGKRESAAMSCVSTASLTVDEKEAWRMLRKELQSIGITPGLFTQHRRLILSTLQKFLTQGQVADFSRVFEAEETETASEAAVINTDSSVQTAYKKLTASDEESPTGRQLEIPVTASGTKQKKRLNIMTRLTSRMMRLTTGKSIDKEISKPFTAGLRYQFHGVCMVCLEDIEVPDSSGPASTNEHNILEDLPSNLIHWKFMDTPCGHTFHITCWKRRLEYPSRCPICYQTISLDNKSLDSSPCDNELNTQEQTQQTSVDKIYTKDPSTGRPVVLFNVVGLFDFNVDGDHLESGYPYLTYSQGELFSVIAEKEELWLAFHRNDAECKIGWLWKVQFYQ